MKPGSFRVEIFGAAKLHPRIAQHLNGPDVVVRGFVPDIDAAILSAPVFLCINNATPFKVGHTRYLLGWSLGACMVAHRDAALSMPEIVDGRMRCSATMPKESPTRSPAPPPTARYAARSGKAVGRPIARCFVQIAWRRKSSSACVSSMQDVANRGPSI